MQNQKKQWFLLLIAFCSGLAIMAFEVSAARILAPFFGTSLFVWSKAIIGAANWLIVCPN
jgi:hypothetical protein